MIIRPDCIQVLRMLAHALLEEAGNAPAALNMIHQIRDQRDGHQDEHSKHGVCLLAIKALMELNRPDEAATELLQMASCKVPMDVVLHALQSLLNGVPESFAISPALQQALHLILEHQQQDMSIRIKVLQLLLEKVCGHPLLLRY